MNHQELQDRIDLERRRGLAYVQTAALRARWALGMTHDGHPMPPITSVRQTRVLLRSQR